MKMRLKLVFMLTLVLLLTPIDMAQAQAPQYRPQYLQIGTSEQRICFENLGYVYPSMNNVGLPFTAKTGTPPPCSTSAMALANAHTFVQGNLPVVITPANMIRVKTHILNAIVPHAPVISYQTWQAYAVGADVNPSVTKMQVIGDWNIQVEPGLQTPDSPVNWHHWREMEVANEIGNINDSRPPGSNAIRITLNPYLHRLWRYPDKTAPNNIPKTLIELCPQASGLTSYQMEIIVAFPYIDTRQGFEEAGIWTLVGHPDDSPVLDVCTEEQLVNYNYVNQSTLLETVPFNVKTVATFSALRKQRLWPIQNMGWEVVGGGMPSFSPSNVAIIIVGAVVIIAIVAVVFGAPTIILVAAVPI